jgi:hypothetical protein
VLRGLRIGEAEVDLRYEREATATTVVVTRKDGDVLVSVQR